MILMIIGQATGISLNKFTDLVVNQLFAPSNTMEGIINNQIITAIKPLPSISSTTTTTTSSLLQLKIQTNAKPKAPYQSISPTCQRMENYWMQQCVTASPGSGIIKNNDPTISKYGT